MGAPVAEIVAGAVEGAANTALSAYQIYKNREDIRNAKRDINKWNETANSMLDDAYANQVKFSSVGDLAKYQQMKASYDPSAYVYDSDAFDKTRYNVENYLNPYRDQVYQDIYRNQNHSAAGAALGHSSGALAAANRAVADKSAEFYDKANEQMRSERNFDYGVYKDYIEQQQQKLNTLHQGYLNQMSLYKDDIQFDQQNQDAYLNNKLALGNSTMQAKANLV